MAGLFHPLLCSFCGFTALFPKGTVLLQLLFACLFQGVTLFCVFPVVDRQCLVLARQCRRKKRVYALPTVWPDVSNVGSQQFALGGWLGLPPPMEEQRPKHAGQHSPTMATFEGTSRPGWCSLSEREERLFTNRSNRPGDDMKDELRTERTTQNQLWQFRVCPSAGRRTSHISSIYPQSARCIYEETKEGSKLKKVPWLGGQHSMGLHAELPLVIVALSLVKLGSRSAWIAHTCSSTSASFG